MAKILFFITHSTLSYDHADMTLRSLGKSIDPVLFDTMYIYNTHDHELSNSDIIDLCHKYDLSKFITNILIWDGIYPQSKTLGADVYTIGQYCKCKYPMNTKIWLLKSDCVVSQYLISDFSKMDIYESFVLTPPFICAKKRVTNEEIIDYCSRPWVILSDDITFFNEDTHKTPDNDHRNRPNMTPYHPSILFISCTVKTDFSCHYLTLDNLLSINISFQNWGGCNFSHLQDKWYGTSRGFVVHKYHNIVSENRPTPREGTIESFMLA